MAQRRVFFQDRERIEAMVGQKGGDLSPLFRGRASGIPAAMPSGTNRVLDECIGDEA